MWNHKICLIDQQPVAITLTDVLEFNHRFAEALRRNHALEHATVAVLLAKHGPMRVAGRARLDGFLLYGDVDTEEITACAREALRRFFHDLSPVSRRNRFFTSSEPPVAVIDRMADSTDPLKALTLVVHRMKSDDLRPVAVASYMAVTARIAEVAFAVDDAFHGRGLATALLERLAVRAAAAGLEQTSVSLEEAAENLGANKNRTIYRIVVPLMAGGILAGFVTSFLTAAVELSATIMLVTSQSDAPASYGIYLYMQSIAGRGPGASRAGRSAIRGPARRRGRPR